ncbi:MAG: hypothetical protein EPN93_17305 [Spirochaetes bacterium]|nr:MAG: hypothetical protein EPN93_17305 [Spirochaetota bacterium]
MSHANIVTLNTNGDAQRRNNPPGEKPLSSRTIAAIQEIILADYILDLMEGVYDSTALTHLFLVPRCGHSASALAPTKEKRAHAQLASAHR